MNKLLVVIALFMAIQFTQAQNYKFGKVSKEELQETANPQDPEANATVLYRREYIHFEYVPGDWFVQKREVHERIKIYNKDGFDQATKVVRLYSKHNATEDDLTGLKAITYNLEGGKIVQTKLKKDGIFEEETNKYWKAKKFTMPNIKEGSVVEYRYTITSPFLRINEVSFQQEIPIKKIDFKLVTPEYYNYKYLLNPKADYIPKLENSSNYKKISFSYRRKENAMASGVKTELVKYDKDIKFNIVTSNSNNIPALKDEVYVGNINNYKSKLLAELEFIKYPNEPIESYSTTWEKVSKKIYEYSDFGEQLRKKNYYQNDINTTISGVDDPLEKTALIYDFVKSKVKWNEYNGYYTYEGVRKAYKEGAGNIADINLMLVSMLRYVGLDANPVLVSTRDNGVPILPTRKGFNYVICSVQFNDGYVLLDATDEFSTANILPLKVLNWQGRLIREDGTSSWVALNPKKSSKQLTSLNVKMNLDLSIEGKVRNQFTEYQALNYRDKYKNHTDEEMIESLQEDKGEIEISNFEVKNKNDLSKKIMQSYEYKYNNAIEQIGGKLYFSPLLFFETVENPFKSETRSYPIDFVYPREDKYIVNIMLPEKYIVESLPEKAKIIFNVDDGEYSCLVRQNGNMLQFTYTLILNKTLILPTEYEVLKQFYQMMIDKQMEKVVLKKG